MCLRSVLGGKSRNLTDWFHAVFLSGTWQCQVVHILQGKRVSWEGVKVMERGGGPGVDDWEGGAAGGSDAMQCDVMRCDVWDVMRSASPQLRTELREKHKPHLPSLSMHDVQTGRGSHGLAHSFAIIPVF